MSAMDHSSLLQRLIIAGEMATQMRHGADRGAVIDLVMAIEVEAKKPHDAPTPMHEAVVLCAQAVEIADTYLRSPLRERAAPFVRVVGVLLPDVRVAMQLAMEQRMRPTP